MPEPGSSKHQVVAVVGPTATGKTLLAESLALDLGGEVVTADSAQVYRGMDIGTSKPPEAERRVVHHCIDLVEPGTPYSAALFQRHSREVIDRLLGKGILPVVAGGTGLYVRAALDEMEFPSGEVSGEIRVRLEETAKRLGAEAMHDRLAEIDPEAAVLIHPRNVRRTIRALEMAEKGASYAGQAARFAERRAVYDAAHIGLAMQRAVLYARIDARVDAMLEAGLLEEVESLLELGFHDALTASQAIGYKEFVPVITSGTDLTEAIDAVKRATRRYAKRQLSWFKADPRIRWIDVTDLSPARALERARELLSSDQPSPYPCDGVAEAEVSP